MASLFPVMFTYQNVRCILELVLLVNDHKCWWHWSDVYPPFPIWYTPPTIYRNEIPDRNLLMLDRIEREYIPRHLDFFAWHGRGNESKDQLIVESI